MPGINWLELVRSACLGWRDPVETTRQEVPDWASPPSPSPAVLSGVRVNDEDGSQAANGYLDGVRRHIEQAARLTNSIAF